MRCQPPCPESAESTERRLAAAIQARLGREMVDDLLDVSRITRGKINLARERVELSDLIERAVETVTPVIEARGHTLKIEMPKRPLGIYGDPLRLTQALRNVLGNAARAADKIADETVEIGPAHATKS